LILALKDVGGTKEPLFVIDTDVKNNIIYTGEGKNHPGLYRNTLFVNNEELYIGFVPIWLYKQANL